MNIQPIYLIGFILDPDLEAPQLYTLYFCSDGRDNPIVEYDRPILHDGKIVFFTTLDLAQSAFRLAEAELGYLEPNFEKVTMICDIAFILYMVYCQDFDDSATIVHSLNLIFDLVKATRLTMPEQYKKALYKFAGHLTFDKEYASFFTENDIARTLIEAVLWCVGAIVCKSKILTNNLSKEAIV